MDEYTAIDNNIVKELTIDCHNTTTEMPPEFVRSIMSQQAFGFKHKEWFSDI